jgi:hypothetical protein
MVCKKWYKNNLKMRLMALLFYSPRGAPHRVAMAIEVLRRVWTKTWDKWRRGLMILLGGIVMMLLMMCRMLLRPPPYPRNCGTERLLGIGRVPRLAAPVLALPVPIRLLLFLLLHPDALPLHLVKAALRTVAIFYLSSPEQFLLAEAVVQVACASTPGVIFGSFKFVVLNVINSLYSTCKVVKGRQIMRSWLLRLTYDPKHSLNSDWTHSYEAFERLLYGVLLHT